MTYGIQTYQLGEILKRNLEQIEIEDDKLYTQVTVRLWGKGVTQRNRVFGHEIKSDSRYVVEAGQFIISKIDARNGASGLIPNELDGAVITGDFLSFNIKDDVILPEYLLWLSKSNWFVEQCLKASSGTTNRVRLNENRFLQISVTLPDISEQARIVQKTKQAYCLITKIENELEQQKQLTIKLRQGILQKAVQGLLVEQDPTEEPAEEVLKRVWEEKERLIKNKKIKRVKPLPPISPEEIPYELPKGWEWIRLDDLSALKNGSIRRGPFGSAIRKDMFVPKGENTYKVYEQKNAIQKDCYLGEYYISEEKYQELQSFSVEPGDIIISCAGTIGETFLLPDYSPKGIINQALLKIRLNNHLIINEFFLYLFDSLTKGQIKDSAKGSAMKNLVSIQYLRENVLFPVPSIEEQKRIVMKLDDLMETSNTIESNIKELVQQKDLLIEAMLIKFFNFS